MDRRLHDIVAATGELPALPSTIARLLGLLDDELASAESVLEVIGCDPALTANLLKLCNSAYYGLRRQVGTVQEALVMLGNRTVVSLAFAASLGDVLRGPLAGYRLERDTLWRHSLAVAIGAAHLADAHGDRALRERAFTAGLVHDIGKLVLNAPLKSKLQQLPQTTDPDELLRGERDILGFDHAEAGRALAEAWNLPADLVTVIGGHHGPGPFGPEPRAVLLRAVVAANLIACGAGFGAGIAAGGDQGRAQLAAMGVADDELTSVAARLAGDVASLADALKGRP